MRCLRVPSGWSSDGTVLIKALVEGAWAAESNSGKGSEMTGAEVTAGVTKLGVTLMGVGVGVLALTGPVS